MNREDIIRMAREAELMSTYDETSPWIEDHPITEYVERFFQAAYAAGAAAEREACAKVCEAHDFYGVAIAKDIRARGNT